MTDARFHMVTLHTDGEGWRAECESCDWSTGLFLASRRWWEFGAQPFKQAWLLAQEKGGTHGRVVP